MEENEEIGRLVFLRGKKKEERRKRKDLFFVKLICFQKDSAGFA